MHGKERFANALWDGHPRPGSAALVILMMLLFLIFLLVFLTFTAQTAQGQTFNVIHFFAGGAAGYGPGNLAMDRTGNLYGPAMNAGPGMIFELSRGHGSDWLFAHIYNFKGGNDGYDPQSVVVGPNGMLYGTTWDGGGTGCDYGEGCGTIFNVRPPATVATSVRSEWTETVLYSLTGGHEGRYPSSPVFDRFGNIYGTANIDGDDNQGTVYQLTQSGGAWTWNVLHTFTGGSDGGRPSALLIDNAGNLYGFTEMGGSYAYGNIFELSPSGSGWTMHTLYSFTGQSDGNGACGLAIDRAGNLYGVTVTNPMHGGASTVFMLTRGNGTWNYSLLYNYEGGYYANIAMDTVGNLYVSTVFNPEGYIFKLTKSGGTWIYSLLHQFNGYDGWSPNGLIVDADGNVYGTTENGGPSGYGVAYQITQ